MVLLAPLTGRSSLTRTLKQRLPPPRSIVEGRLRLFRHLVNPVLLPRPVALLPPSIIDSPLLLIPHRIVLPREFSDKGMARLRNLSVNVTIPLFSIGPHLLLSPVLPLLSTVLALQSVLHKSFYWVPVVPTVQCLPPIGMINRGLVPIVILLLMPLAATPKLLAPGLRQLTLLKKDPQSPKLKLRPLSR